VPWPNAASNASSRGSAQANVGKPGPGDENRVGIRRQGRRERDPCEMAPQDGASRRLFETASFDGPSKRSLETVSFDGHSKRRRAGAAGRRHARRPRRGEAPRAHCADGLRPRDALAATVTVLGVVCSGG
jgi:hypothetical protein